MTVRWDNTADVALLDLSAVRGANCEQLEKWAAEYRLAVSDSLLAELITMEPAGNPHHHLAKLIGLRCVLLEDIEAHYRWELFHSEPACLLLSDDSCQGDPYRSAQAGIKGVLNSITASDTLRQGFTQTVDGPNEASWEQLQLGFIRDMIDSEEVESLKRQDLPSRYAWIEAHFGGHSNPFFKGLFRSWIGLLVEATDCCVLESRADSMMNRDWLVYRVFVLQCSYAMLNAAAGGNSLGHDRLNQRYDLRYQALLKGKMSFVTADQQMQNLARLVCPEVSIIDPLRGESDTGQAASCSHSQNCPTN